MPQMKATDIVVLKKIFAEKDGTLEADFLAHLSTDLRDAYEKVIFTTKLPVEMIDQIYNQAAKILFPGSADQYIRFGKCVAERSFSTVYKVFMRIPTRQFVISRSPAVWQSYHEKGEARIENLTDQSGDFMVAHYPELPRVLRLVAGGHLAKMLELIGSRNVMVEHHESDPNCWRWHLTWEN